MKKSKKKNPKKEWADALMANKLGMIIFGVIVIVFGLFMSLTQLYNKPIAYTKAEYYTATYEKISQSRNYFTLHTSDGETFDFYTHILTADQAEKIESIPKGTSVFLRVNPNNGYIVEFKAGTEIILDFDETQEKIVSYSYGYVGIGVFACLCGVTICFPFILSIGKEKEAKRQRKRDEKRIDGMDSVALRPADITKKCKILLAVSIKDFDICYRRVRFTNELVVNGYVYDEAKGFLEFDHQLSAVIQGHKIAAGLQDINSYIKFDGRKVASKKRAIIDKKSGI